MVEQQPDWPMGIPYCKCGEKPTDHLCPRDVAALKEQADAKNDLREELHRKDLQVGELTEILEAAEGMFTHGSALNGTHATILRMKIDGYRGRTAQKRSCTGHIGKDGTPCVRCGQVIS